MAELKEYSLETIQKHNNADSCWLVVNNCVYDATKFLDLHPGGDTIVLEYAGTDCTAAFETDVHTHSQSAHVMLKEYLIGYVEGTGASQKKKNAEASSAEKAELVDFKKAVLPQIISLGPKYQPWVHTTSTTKMRIFEWDFFEALSYHPWWYIFFVWIPVISFLLYESLEKGNTYVTCFSCFLVGMAAWTLVEYLIHRFIFHFDSATPLGNFLHFFLHGAHHLTPMEPSRLTFPPTFAPPVGILLYHFFSYLFPAHVYQAVFAGGAFMYMMYDTMHYYFHHGDCFNIGYLKEMKKRHLSHHFKDDLKNFGVTNPFWDIVFGTNGPEWSLTDSNPLDKEVK